MAPATQRALCGARRLMWACTAVYLLVGLLNTFLSCGAGAMASPRRSRYARGRWWGFWDFHIYMYIQTINHSIPDNPTPQIRNPRFLTHALTVLAAVQLLAGVALSWMWTGIKQGVEAVRERHSCICIYRHTYIYMYVYIYTYNQPSKHLPS